jgi:hypothetical protein
MNNSDTPRPLILLAEDEAIIALELADSLSGGLCGGRAVHHLHGGRGVAQGA